MNKNIIIIVGLVILGLLFFGGENYISTRKEKNKLKEKLKNSEKKADSLQILFDDSMIYNKTEETNQKTYWYEYKKERDLRIKAEKELNAYYILSNRVADSIITNYRFIKDK